MKDVVPKMQRRMQEKTPREAKRPTQGTLKWEEAERGVGSCCVLTVRMQQMMNVSDAEVYVSAVGQWSFVDRQKVMLDAMKDEINNFALEYYLGSPPSRNLCNSTLESIME